MLALLLRLENLYVNEDPKIIGNLRNKNIEGLRTSFNNMRDNESCSSVKPYDFVKYTEATCAFISTAVNYLLPYGNVEYENVQMSSLGERLQQNYSLKCYYGKKKKSLIFFLQILRV